MEKKYYLQNGQEKIGPFSIDELRYMHIKRSDFIWNDEFPDWLEAQNISELSVLFPSEPQSLPSINLSNPKELIKQPAFSGNKITQFANGIIQLENAKEIITYRYANFGERLGARILDVLIIVIPSICLPIIGSWLYFALQYSSDDQQTIGQKALDIKLLSTDGEKIQFGQATGRYFGNLLNVLTIYIGFLMFFFNDKNQCLHDVLSGTIVVKELERKGLIDIY